MVEVSTTLEVLSCTEGTLPGADGTTLGGMPFWEVKTGPTGEVI